METKGIGLVLRYKGFQILGLLINSLDSSIERNYFSFSDYCYYLQVRLVWLHFRSIF